MKATSLRLTFIYDFVKGFRRKRRSFLFFIEKKETKNSS